MGEYTKLSKEAFGRLMQNTLSPSEAVSFFISNVPMRTFRDVLTAAYPCEDISRRLVDGLFVFRSAFCDIYLSQDAKARRPIRDTIRRNVANWVEGVTAPQKRLDIFGICFALGLKVDDADEFLRQTSGYGFHLREPLEIALFYCLACGKSIEDSAELVKTLDLSIPEATPEADAKATDIVEGEFWNKVTDDESLVRFLHENRASFGKMHNTAHKYFRYYYDALSVLEKAEDCPAKDTKKGASIPYVDKIPIGQVVARRLRFGVPLAENLRGYSEYQATIRESWLGETSVKLMLKRQVDVSRKALLLLYIATGGAGKTTDLYRATTDGISTDDVRHFDRGDIDHFEDELASWDAYDDLTPQQSLEEHTTHLDLILQDCGFARLDPRTPFDWLVLYSLCVDEAEASNDSQTKGMGLMSERLEKVLTDLYAGLSGNDLHDDM